MGRLVQIGIVFVIVAGLFAVIDLTMNPSGSPVRTTLDAVRNTAMSGYRRITGQPEPPKAPEKPAMVPSGRSSSSSRRAPSAEPRSPDAARTGGAVDAPVVAPAPIPPLTPRTSAPPATPSRVSSYMPANRTTWADLDVPVGSPLVIRSAGRLVAGTDASGPNGLTTSAFERSLAPTPGRHARVLPTAPYLSLIGRVCDGNRCTDPFLIGSNFVMCPADVSLGDGHLQLWTNNYIHLDGRATTAAYSNALGGYSYDIEPASDELCSNTARKAAPASPRDAAVLQTGQSLRRPEFTISSSQTAWKPFFVPLSMPVVIKANGTMQPHTGARPTGPDGVVVPSSARGPWFYPGTRDVVVDAAHPLFLPAFPYQALIGRLCGPADCGTPFLVGNNRLICATAPHNERLELWINHIVSPGGLLSSQMPVSLDAFAMQARQGQYQFELVSAPADACDRQRDSADVR